MFTLFSMVSPYGSSLNLSNFPRFCPFPTTEQPLKLRWSNWRWFPHSAPYTSADLLQLYFCFPPVADDSASSIFSVLPLPQVHQWNVRDTPHCEETHTLVLLGLNNTQALMIRAVFAFAGTLFSQRYQHLTSFFALMSMKRKKFLWLSRSSNFRRFVHLYLPSTFRRPQ